MEKFPFHLAMASFEIAIFLALFYGIYTKRKEVGPGMDTPEKRIYLYSALGIGGVFVGSGILFLRLGRLFHS